MTIAQIRKLLTKKEMDRVTEKALEGGPFVIRTIRRIGNQLEVEVRYPKDGNRTQLLVL